MIPAGWGCESQTHCVRNCRIYKPPPFIVSAHKTCLISLTVHPQALVLLVCETKPVPLVIAHEQPAWEEGGSRESDESITLKVQQQGHTSQTTASPDSPISILGVHEAEAEAPVETSFVKEIALP